MTSPSVITKHLTDALSPSPRVALVGVRMLRDEALPWLEERAVRQARADGLGWGFIGRCLGISRQAARKRFATIDGTPQPLVKRPVSEAERCMWLFNSAKDDARLRREYAELPDDEANPGDSRIRSTGQAHGSDPDVDPAAHAPGRVASGW